MRTREEHLTECKRRAMEYVEHGQLLDAVTSMMSDLDKHPETKVASGSVLTMLGLLAAMDAQNGHRDAVVRYIKGFN